MSGVQGRAAESARSVLIVDDEASVRHLMRRWLESRGYKVKAVDGAAVALEVMASTPAAVALCDLRMPGRDGLWLTDRLRREHPDTAVIIASGANDLAGAPAELRNGIVEFLTKPFARERLCEAVSRGVEWHRSACDSRRWRESLERELRDRCAHLSQIIESQFVDSDDALDILWATLTATNLDTYSHGLRVAALAVRLARELGVSDAETATIHRGALLHDVGKVTMPDAVLRKPAPLTLEERRLIRMHPAIGSALIAPVPYLSTAAVVVRDAHERIDGRGYPHGKRGDEIWLGARIVSVADSYDTMTRPRVFCDAVTPATALAEIARCSGTQFDPRVVAAMRTLTRDS